MPIMIRWSLPVIAALAVAVNGCVTVPATGPSAQLPVPGWVEVKVPPASALRNPRTRLFIDQVVGPVLANGVEPDELMWLKPVYGNQNLAWFHRPLAFAQALGGQYMDRVQDADPPWQARRHRVQSAAVEWTSVAMSPPEEDFQLTLYYCRPRQEQTPVILYWGGEGKAFADTLKQIVARFADECA